MSPTCSVTLIHVISCVRYFSRNTGKWDFSTVHISFYVTIRRPDSFLLENRSESNVFSEYVTHQTILMRHCLNTGVVLKIARRQMLSAWCICACACLEAWALLVIERIYLYLIISCTNVCAWGNSTRQKMPLLRVYVGRKLFNGRNRNYFQWSTLFVIIHCYYIVNIIGSKHFPNNVFTPLSLHTALH